MKTYHIIKLKFQTPLHLGDGKENYDFSASELHSDTLSAALAAIKAQTAPDAESLYRFLTSFTLSSAFPFVGNLYFLPRIVGRIPFSGLNEDKQRKQLKKIRYIESGLWSQMATGTCPTLSSKWIQGEYLLASDEQADKFVKPFVNQVTQRVTVSRDGGDKNALPFFFEWRFFQPQAGLYCITDVQGDLFKELCTLFEALGEAGLGTDKNVGGGHFVIETDTLKLPEVQDADATVLLSLYLPNEEDLSKIPLSSSRYQLIQRGGMIAGSSVHQLRHLWKKSVYMFTEGSLFPILHPLEGRVLDLRPDWGALKMHPVYRSGRAFSLPIKCIPV